MLCAITPASNITVALMIALVLALIAAAAYPVLRRDLTTVTKMVASTVLIALAAAFGHFVVGSSHSYARFDDRGLTLDIPIYGRHVPWNELQAEASEVLDLGEHNDFALARRTNGLGMYGYSIGWFSLVNGKPALVAVTDKTRVVHLSTKDGTSILFSCRQGNDVVDWLLNRARATVADDRWFRIREVSLG